MDSQVLDDFHAALLALDDMATVPESDAEAEQRIADLAEEVFGFLDSHAFVQTADYESLAA